MGLLWFNLIMFAFYLPSLILHEYGHALVGRLIGLRLKSVSIGKGEPFLRIGHFFVAKKQIWEGLYQPYPPTVPLRRGQRAALLLGGIFANFIAGLFVSGLSQLFPSPVMHLLAPPFIQISIIFILFNLIPIRLTSGFPSDGLQLKRLFFNKNSRTD